MAHEEIIGKKTYSLFINNQWVSSASGKTFQVVNPATEEVLAEVAEGTPADVDTAVQAAHRALNSEAWGKMSPKERSRKLFKLADGLGKRLEEVARWETLNTGKTLFESKAVEIPMCVDLLRYYAGWAMNLEGRTLPLDHSFFGYTLREPVGVVGAITPWNFPLLLAMWKIAPALAAGCTVVLKPASLTPITALCFAEVVQESGLPEGVFNVVPGPGSSTGRALVQHPQVQKISFTGETSTGKEIMKMAADGVKRVTLELGGKSPNIVFADADLETAAKGSFNAIFYNKGEVCCAGSRLFVEQSVHEKVMATLLDRAKACTLGDPLDKKTRMGPVISKGQMDKVLSYIDKGKKEGARLVTGGSRPEHLRQGYFISPTIFDQATNDMTISREEIFGPVLSVIPFQNVQDVLEKANQTFYGLAAGLWTRDLSKAHRVARALQAGTVWINNYNFFDVNTPFGGYKQSGFGRELGQEALNHYTELKTVLVAL